MKVKIAGLKSIAKLWGKFHWEEGIQSVGDLYFRTDSLNDPRLNDVDCFYQFNVYNKYRHNKQSKKDAFNFVAKSNKPVLVREEGCFRQFPDYKTFGWNHYHNKKGNFNNTNITDDSRWKKFVKDTGIIVRDWKSQGDNILILGQVERDSAIIPLYEEGYTSVTNWIVRTIETIRQYTDRPIVVRPHPLNSIKLYKKEVELNKQYKNVKISTNYNQTTTLNGGVGLYADLNDAYCAVGYNSNSLVEAATHGVPIFVMNKFSMAYDIGHHDLSNIESLNYNLDRTDWQNKVVYTLWNGDEVRSGQCWEHLKPVYF